MSGARPQAPVRMSFGGYDVAEAAETFSTHYGIHGFRSSSSGVPFSWGHRAVGDELSTYRTSLFSAEVGGFTSTGDEFIVMWNSAGTTELLDGRDVIRFGTGIPVVLPTDRIFSFKHDTVRQNLVHLSRRYVKDIAAETGHQENVVRFDTNASLQPADLQPWWEAMRHTAAILAGPSSEIARESVRRSAALALLTSFLRPEVPAVRSARDPGRVRAAREFIEAEIHRPITPSDVARAVGISTRGLQQAFKSHIGTTPAAEIRNARLDAVRRDLLLSDPETTTVSTVALSWGMTHLGRFAASYRDRFGELPRQTLHR